MKDLLEFIVKSLVSKPDQVRIVESTAGTVVNFDLAVDPEDMGIIIGKAGQTIRAIRRLLIARALIEDRNLRVNLNLQEK